MVAPGDNLEFQASAFFRDRSNRVKDLLEHVKEFLKREPGAGKPLCPGIQELEIKMNEIGYLVFLARRGNRISLMYVYQVHEIDLIRSRKRELLQFYGKGGLA